LNEPTALVPHRAEVCCPLVVLPTVNVCSLRAVALESHSDLMSQNRRYAFGMATALALVACSGPDGADLFEDGAVGSASGTGGTVGAAATSDGAGASGSSTEAATKD
jgi:hypothetical protein